MPFEIILAPEAAETIKSLRANVRAEVKDGIELHLRHEPTKTSRSRIKRLHALDHPQYRLRLGQVRVFYDVHDDVVEVLAVVPKSEADLWLKQFENPE
jgi:mRNA-degrading endonuclease RelE of RelBE toxin-antitoxin system